jgi:hypothetical protein
MRNCTVCGNGGWLLDEMSLFTGGPPRKYCYCEHGDRLCSADEEKKRLHKLEFKPCATCKGTGEVKIED